MKPERTKEERTKSRRTLKKKIHDASADFISTTENIIQTEGIEAVSIREVARRTGRNSATIYSLFENLDHLIICSSLKILQRYNEDLDTLLGQEMSDEERYFVTWECFLTHVLEEPDVYEKLFSNDLPFDLEMIFQNYFEIFPDEEKNFEAKVSSILHQSDLGGRNLHFIEFYLGDTLDEESARGFSEAGVFLFWGTLFSFKKEMWEIEETKEMFLTYLKRLYRGFLREPL